MTSRYALPAFLVFAAVSLAGCATTAPATETTPTATASVGCMQVTVVIDFGPLDHEPLELCAASGVATDILADAAILTEGTVDYGDQVVCRVNNEPAPDEQVTFDGQEPFTESCQTLNSVAYWALWVKSSADADWEYADEGVGTLELTDGQSMGLVYSSATESVPPQN